MLSSLHSCFVIDGDLVSIPKSITWRLDEFLSMLSKVRSTEFVTFLKIADFQNDKSSRPLIIYEECQIYPFEAIFNDFEQDNVDQFLRNSLSGGCFWPFSTSKVCFRG